MSNARKLTVKLEKTRADLQASGERIAELEEQVRERDGTLEELCAKWATHDAAVATLRDQLVEARSQAERLRAMVDQQEKDAESERLRAVEGERKLWQDLLARANRQNDKLERRLESLEQDAT